MLKIGINGFGRIGRLILRAGSQDPKIKFVGINDLTDPTTLAYLLKHDSIHGKFPGEVFATADGINVNGKDIPVTAEKDPEQLPWQHYKVDTVFECTGRFRTQELVSKHLKAGAKKVLLSAPIKKGHAHTIVMGVNDKTYKGQDIVSNASCTTNCFAPMAKVLHDNYGIKSGVMTTIHSYTNDQVVLDAPHQDLRRGRSAAINIIPTSTGAARAIGEVIPALDGKIVGSAIRVPTADASLCHFTAETKKRCKDNAELNTLYRKASRKQLKGILEYSEEPLVSSDIVNNPHSCVYDATLSKTIGNQIIVVGWYDNEYGYSCRMLDVAKIMNKK